MDASAHAMPEGRFTSEKLRDVLAEVCGQTGLDHRGAQLLKFTNNAVYRLLRDPVVVRIVGSRALRHRVHKVVGIANWLAEYEVPAVRLLPGARQPIAVDEHLATLWQAEPGHGRKPTAKDLARLLRQLHDLPLPPFELPEWAPLDDVRRRLGDAEELAPDDRRFLENRCDELQAQLDEMHLELDRRVVHGDAHLGNLIRAVPGPVLCDFDSSCVGPAEWDLTPVPVGVRRLGHPRRGQRQLARVYGYDVTRSPAFEVLSAVRELKLTTSVLPIVRSHPGVREELFHRLADLRRGSGLRWSNFR
jgi:aminoglycoside phosphotransferase (APT) family kinase protein